MTGVPREYQHSAVLRLDAHVGPSNVIAFISHAALSASDLCLSHTTGFVASCCA